MSQPIQLKPGEKLRDSQKFTSIPIKVVPTEKGEALRKPEWLKIKLPKTTERIEHIKSTLRKHNLHSVCEEASCPNLPECFNHGTATFMILGDVCTRRCPFCDVAHGKPLKPDENEPKSLALALKDMRLNYIVITSVDRDDLRDGGATQFARCVEEIRLLTPEVKIEILVPDFKGRMDTALDILDKFPPDVFNHNLESVPRIYLKVRPAANYHWSLRLLEQFKQRHPHIPTKSGLMVGLGETNEELVEVFRDLREHGVDMLTVGQYLQPSMHHLPVERYVTPDEFLWLKQEAEKLGFKNVASGPFVRSSYHADKQAMGKDVS